MHIDAICETNGKGWLIWAAQCPGAFARGATENEALAKLPGDVRRFLHWAGEPAGDITVTPGAPIESACTPRTPIPTCCSRPTAPR